MKGKVIAILTVFAFLLLAASPQEAVKLLDIVKSDAQGKEMLLIKTDRSVTMPNFYPSDKDPTLLILEFEGVRPAENLTMEKNFDKGLISQVKVTDEGGEVKVFLKFQEMQPFSIYLVEKGLVVETQLKKEKRDEKYAEKSLLEDVRILKKPGQLEVNIDFAPGVPLFREFTLDRDEVHGKPPRLVIDLQNTTARTLKRLINQLGVKQLRVAQFKPNIARIVFDLEKEVEYKIERIDSNTLAVIFPSEKGSEVQKEKIVFNKMEKPSPEGSKKEENGKMQTSSSSQPTKTVTVAEKKTKPVTKVIKGEEKKYYGEKYTFRFKDADLRDVLRFIARIANLNIIFDPGVTGKVTCDLVDVPWDQALELILKANKLGYTIEGNVLRIAKMDVLAREEEERRRLQEAAAPLRVITRSLSYADVRKITGILQKYLSARGEIVTDERTNTLIIKDIPANIELMDRLIDTLDTPIPQVSIEARIVETISTFTRNLGIQWGFMGYAHPYYGNQTNLVFPNRITIDGTPISGGQIGGISENPLGGYAVNLPAPAFNSAIGISLGNVTDSFGLDMALTALEQQGYGRILSAPRITTEDNKEAHIMQGRQIPVQTIINNTIMVRYVPAALELRVTPHITPEGTIIMDINIQNNAADFANLVNGIPPIITQSARTSVLVKDGGTAVIGGIYRIEDSTTINKTPFLHSIPIIGKLLFRGSSVKRENRELLIFITPRIVKK